MSSKMFWEDLNRNLRLFLDEFLVILKLFLKSFYGDLDIIFGFSEV
jgi:hypothetical protein